MVDRAWNAMPSALWDLGPTNSTNPTNASNLRDSTTQRTRCMLAIRLSPDIEERLDQLSKKTGRTKTYYAREAIVEYLDDLEDYYLAVDRLKSPGRRWTLEEVEQELGLGN